MKKSIVYLLLPLCITFLPACSQSYTLTLVNSDPEAGTILTEGGTFKAGEQVRIETELVKGYKVQKWVDDISGKIGSRPEFNFMMPNRDATLTVYFEYDSYTLSFKETCTADENHYDFTTYIENGLHLWSLVTFNNESTSWFAYETEKEFTWKDPVLVKYSGSFFDTSCVEFDGLYSEDGTKLGDTEYSFNMPYNDVEIALNYTSRCYFLKVTCNYDVVYNYSSSSGGTWVNYYDSDGVGHPGTLIPDTNKTLKVTQCMSTEGYVFDHWINLDTNETISEDSITINNLLPINNLQMVLREA